MSKNAALNPPSSVELYAPMIKPLSQLDLSSKSGPAGSAREIARAEAAKQGYEDGFRSGYEAGEIAARQQFEDAHAAALEAFVEDLSQRGQQIEGAFSEWCSKLEDPLAELASVIACRIVARELTTDAETVVSIVKQAVAEVTHANDARIKVNPFDSEVLNSHKSDLLAASGGLRTIEIIEDPSILGGCVVETEGGSIDAKIETMLDRARTALRGDR